MRKIINTLRYGKTKTKTLIISVFVLMTAAIVLGIIGINGMNIILLGISMVLFIICVFMVFKLEGTTADVGEDDDAEKSERSGKAVRDKKPEKLEESEKPEGSGPEKSGKTARSEKPGKPENSEMPEKSENTERPGRQETAEISLRTLRGKTRGPKTVRSQLEKKLLIEIIKANRRSVALNKKTYGDRMKVSVKQQQKKLKEMRDARVGRSTEIRNEREAVSERASRAEIRDEREVASERASHAEKKTDYKTYTKNELKRLRKIYKIPKDACRIIIDSCKSLAIDHAPALFWVKKGRIYLLVFEETARCETLPMFNMKVGYKKNIREEEIIKYNAMREMGVYKEFEDMMPTFSVHGGATGNEYFKNLYVLGKDLVITPRSLRYLMIQFDFEIRIFDSLDIRGNYSDYFRKAYEQRVMWTDGVISQNQYQKNIRDILQSMVDDDTIIRYDFMDDLEKMVHHRLITDEYAEFYKNKRL
ncbi:MAG: hypothetical protein K6F44_03105 [Lachnospiraceae bacterium]|nr:hypothetical protein [Lachnospiraceae bacterium]